MTSDAPKIVSSHQCDPNYARTVLMNPGPVMVDERVRQALLAPDTCHRESEFAELLTRVREKITRICRGDQRYTTVVFTGSGTAALEATFSSIVRASDKVLILDNGHYGERLSKIASVHGILYERLEFGWGVEIDLSALNHALTRDLSITHVGMVHHETSTGMLNPIHAAGEIVHKHGRSLIVDAISSLGAEYLDLVKDHIDWCVGTSNKCLEGFPGVSFVCASHASLDALATIPRRTLYLDIYSQYVAEDKEKFPLFTPAVQTLYALDRALDLTIREGVDQRIARYEALANRLRIGLSEMGFRFLVPAEHRSNSLTAIYLPDAVSYRDLHDTLKQEGFVIYAGQENLKNRVFRLANMGQITSEDVDRFLAALGSALVSLGVKSSTE